MALSIASAFSMINRTITVGGVIEQAHGNNKGWRIDYCLVSETLKDKLKRAYILPEAKHSDHCPVVVEIE